MSGVPPIKMTAIRPVMFPDRTVEAGESMTLVSVLEVKEALLPSEESRAVYAVRCEQEEVVRAMPMDAVSYPKIGTSDDSSS